MILGDNLNLKKTIFAVVDKQIMENNPLETRWVFERLVSEEYPDEEAK